MADGEILRFAALLCMRPRSHKLQRSHKLSTTRMSRAVASPSGFGEYAFKIALVLGLIVTTCVGAIAQSVGPDVSSPQKVGGAIIQVPDSLPTQPKTDNTIPITIVMADRAQQDCELRIIGLPTAAQLLNGREIAPGAWSIPVSDATQLRLRLPDLTPSQWKITIAVVTPDGGVLARTWSTLLVARAEPSLPDVEIRRQPTTSASGSDQGASPTAVPTATGALPTGDGDTSVQRPAFSAIETKRFLEMGGAQEANGNISAARLFYKKASDLGDPAGARALGRSYDPDVLSSRGVVGMSGDAKTAERWYAKARELGGGGTSQ